jgi:threonyl-tRNA synthetase
MTSITVTLSDGSKRQYEAGTTAGQIAKEISRRLEENAVAAKLDGKIVDLTTPLQTDTALVILTQDTKEGLEVIRHSTAHLLAMAVKELFPETQVTIGPVTEDGFYYDFDRPTQFVPEDLPKIEKRMGEIAARKLDVKRSEHPKEKVISLFKEMREDFKVEIINELPGSVFSTYQQGDFVDLCRGPHVPNTARLGKFKLLSIAGAYWRGDEKNKMLQRIYGTAFATQKELDEHLKRIEEAKKRDHRRLGPELGLFTFLPVAPAMPFYLPKGARLLDLMADHIRKETRPRGYDEVICPQLMSTDLWKTSGHLDYYRENMYLVEMSDHQTLCLKPMNCPGHCALFGSMQHSYRDLPIRYSEFSKLHRYERAGVTHGLFRTRTFSQDDAHIFCREDQLQEESIAVIQHTYEIYRQFGFTEVEVKLATRPDKFAGTIENWDRAIRLLEDSLNFAGKPFTIVEKEGAFYGPKIEFHIKDSIGRTWQCGTVQMDFVLPERFKLEYIGTDSKPIRPVMIHRAILGSFERFMGILIEHHAGHLPLWINPVQGVVINVTPDQEAYAKEVAATLTGWGLRVQTDLRNEKLGYKIREAQLQRVPLMLVLGNKETESRTLSVRKSSGETTNDLSLEAFKTFLEQELKPGGKTH